MNRFAAILAGFVLATLSGCTLAGSSYRYDPAGVDHRPLRPSAPARDPFAASPAPATVAGSPVTPLSGPSAGVPPPPSGVASIAGPLWCGDPPGVLSLEIVNRSSLWISVKVGNVPLVPMEGPPDPEHPMLVRPGGSVYTCLPVLGTRRVEVNTFLLAGSERIPFLVRSDGEAFTFCEDYGMARRQTVVYWGKDLSYSGWRC